MTTVSIHQPEYFPWLGFLEKSRRSDIFVLLDTVQFDRSSLQQRCRVIGANGPLWMTIPFVHKHPQTLRELAFADGRWSRKHMKSLQAAYGRAAGWASARGALDEFFETPFERVVDATSASCEMLMDAFDARPKKLVKASVLSATGARDELVLNICKELGATRYISGRSGATYLDANAFEAAGVEVEVQSFTLPAYERPKPVSDEDMYGVSALDAWACLGDSASLVLGPRSAPGEAAK